MASPNMITLPDGGDIYEVEKIVGCEMRDKKYLYRVRWKGCPRDQDTWEPEENLLYCDMLLKNFKEEHERKRRKRKLKREQMRKIRLGELEPIRVKTEPSGSSDPEDGKRSRPSSGLVSPASDFDDFDITGLTRKQRQQVEKVFEESKKVADLSSPNSVCSDGSLDEGIVKTKKKKIRRRSAIDSSSDSDDLSSNLGESDDKKGEINLMNRSMEDAEQNKGKKPSEIIGDLFGTPEKKSRLHIDAMLSNSPVSSIEPGVNSTTLRNDAISEEQFPICSLNNTHNADSYIPLLDQLQQKTEYVDLRSPMSLGTSIDICNSSNAASGLSISEKHDGSYSSDLNYSIPSHTHKNSVSKSNTDSQESKFSIKSENTKREGSTTAGIPSMSMLKLDSGKNKWAYLKGVENIRNQLAMKKMMTNNEISGNGDKKDVGLLIKKPDWEKDKVDAGNENEGKKDPGKIVSESPRHPLFNNGNLKMVRDVISSISISGDKSPSIKESVSLNVGGQIENQNISNKGVHSTKYTKMDESNVTRKSFSKRTSSSSSKLSRSEKLLNDMKGSEGTVRRLEKAKKLSLKEYKAKKAPKQSLTPISQPLLMEFTKVPPLQSMTSGNSNVINSTDKITIIPPKPVAIKRKSTDKKVKTPKADQIGTGADVLGNILDLNSKPKKDGRETSSCQESLIDNSEGSDIGTDLDEYSGDEDGLLRSEICSRPSHLTLPYANSKTLDLLTVYQAIFRSDIDTLVRCNVPEDKINAYVDESDTLLMKAVFHQNVQAAQILLEKKADPNKTSKNGIRKDKTPLMVAVELNQKSMVGLLIQKGAFMNRQLPNGETALIMAAKHGHMEIIHLLLNYGVDVVPAASFLERKKVPLHLHQNVQTTFYQHTEKLKEITEKVLKDLISIWNTKLGKPLINCRCLSPDELEKHEFYFKPDVNVLNPQLNVLLLALPVSFKRNGGLEPIFDDQKKAIENVSLNNKKLIPPIPGQSFIYTLLPNHGEVNTICIKTTRNYKHKILLTIYSMLYLERTVNNTIRTEGNVFRPTCNPVPVH